MKLRRCVTSVEQDIREGRLPQHEQVTSASGATVSSAPSRAFFFANAETMYFQISPGVFIMLTFYQCFDRFFFFTCFVLLSQKLFSIELWQASISHVGTQLEGTWI